MYSEVIWCLLTSFRSVLMHSNVFIPSEVFLCISIGLLSSLQCSAGRKVPHAERYMYLPIYTRLLFRFHFIPHAERFRTQNGSARRTVSRAERFRTQNGSARRTVPHAEWYMYSLSAVDAVFTVNCCDWNCWQRWRLTQMGKVPPFFWPRAGAMARGLGPSGLARAPHERGGSKKGGLFPFGWGATFASSSNHSNWL